MCSRPKRMHPLNRSTYCRKGNQQYPGWMTRPCGKRSGASQTQGGCPRVDEVGSSGRSSRTSDGLIRAEGHWGPTTILESVTFRTLDPDDDVRKKSGKPPEHPQPQLRIADNLIAAAQSEDLNSALNRLWL